MASSTKSIGGTNDKRWLTWPNLITALRIIGSPGLIILAGIDRPLWLGCLVAILVMTEWLDGFLARSLHEESALGARLDSVADAFFYSSLLVALVVLNPTLIWHEANWIGAAVGSYLVSWLVSWIKFGHLPSYHTWAAKGVWFVVGPGIICLLLGWNAWLFPVAMICVVLTNLEAIVITLMLPECRVNVSSVWHVLHSAQGFRRS